MSEESERIRRVLAEVRGSHVLDVGCSSTHVRPDSGRWLHGRLTDRFDRVWGVDRSLEGVARMRAAGFHRTVVADAQALPFAGRFDTIVAGEVIEHLQNPGRFLAIARECLSPGGRIIVTTPYPFALLNVLYALVKYPRTSENEDHVLWLCPRTLEELARRQDLEVEHWELVEDYKRDSQSRLYRWFVRALGILGAILPDRLRCNALLFVLREPADSSDPGDLAGSRGLNEPEPTRGRHRTTGRLPR